MRIILDALGGDKAPLEVLKGAALAVKSYDVKILLTGETKQLRELAHSQNISLAGIDIMEAEGAITMEDAPLDILRSKKNCSMGVGLRALADGKGDAFVCAGNTGALTVGSRSMLGCVGTLRRPALAPVLPHNSGCFMLIDAGANVECRPDMLLNFGHMGSIYIEKIIGISPPRVGLANIGSEDHKGTRLMQESYALLKNSNLHFVGNVEGRDIPFGACDVLVADGFTGNMILKLMEGMGLFMGQAMKEMFTKNPLTMGAALLMRSSMVDLKKKMDYSEYGGAPLMGLKKPVIKSHGSSNARAFQNAIRQAISFVDKDVIGAIEDSLKMEAAAG